MSQVIAAVDGQAYRVSFVHSAHDLKTSRANENPGGFRQVADHLALSLRRRVSIACIERIETVPGATKRSDPVTVYVPVGLGFAVCHHTDQFVKSFGRGLSLLKALRNSGLPKDVQNDIAGAQGYNGVPGLVEDFERAHERAVANAEGKEVEFIPDFEVR